MTESNPNGANQWIPDPRQAKFISLYFDDQSETFSNALQSAIQAGYEPNYAETLTAAMPKWLLEKTSKLKLVKQAEKNLDSFLKLDESDNGKLKVKYQATAFTLERLDRKNYAAKIDIDVTSDGKSFAGFQYTKPIEVEAHNVTGLTETNRTDQSLDNTPGSLLNAA